MKCYASSFLRRRFGFTELPHELQPTCICKHEGNPFFPCLKARRLATSFDKNLRSTTISARSSGLLGVENTGPLTEAVALDTELATVAGLAVEGSLMLRACGTVHRLVAQRWNRSQKSKFEKQDRLGDVLDVCYWGFSTCQTKEANGVRSEAHYSLSDHFYTLKYL